MYLFDNDEDSNNSYYLLDFEFFTSGKYLFERLNNFKFYFHRNFANSRTQESTNENIMIGTQLDFKITDALKLYLDFQNVYYDLNNDTIVDKIETFSIQFKYNIK